MRRGRGGEAQPEEVPSWLPIVRRPRRFRTASSPRSTGRPAVSVAEGLGRATLIRVAQRDADAVQEWCLQCARANVGEANAPRAASYVELAILCGFTGTEAEELHARLDWDDLVRRAERLAAEVRRCAAEHKAALEANAAVEEQAS